MLARHGQRLIDAETGAARRALMRAQRQRGGAHIATFLDDDFLIEAARPTIYGAIVDAAVTLGRAASVDLQLVDRRCAAATRCSAWSRPRGSRTGSRVCSIRSWRGSGEPMLKKIETASSARSPLQPGTRRGLWILAVLDVGVVAWMAAMGEWFDETSRLTAVVTLGGNHLLVLWLAVADSRSSAPWPP
jgi:hypothetical protein